MGDRDEQSSKAYIDKITEELAKIKQKDRIYHRYILQIMQLQIYMKNL